ncbi:MAG: hypothetical protein V4617_14725 [Gemmatimonadota bacterium]
MTHSTKSTGSSPAKPVRVARLHAIVALIGLALAAGPDALSAQGNDKGKGKAKAKQGAVTQDRGRDDNGRRGAQGIPPGHLPSAGECRVWFDGRPPGQQSAPTSCNRAEAIAASTGGRVIYGEDRRGDDRRDDRRDDRSRDRTYPTTLPGMIWGRNYSRGERSNDVRQWLGADGMRVSYADVDRNGTPEVVTWSNSAGQIVQRWIDDNRDGRADRVALYQNNQIVRVIK